jgi:hypothetical protein
VARQKSEYFYSEKSTCLPDLKLYKSKVENHKVIKSSLCGLCVFAGEINARKDAKSAKENKEISSFLSIGIIYEFLPGSEFGLDKRFSLLQH